MATLFLDVIDFFALLEEQASNLQGGNAEDVLSFLDSGDHNFQALAAFSTLAFNEVVGLDLAVYQISLADTLALVDVAQRGPAAAASDFLTLGDVAKLAAADRGQHTLAWLQTAVAVPTRGVQNNWPLTQLAAVHLTRTLAVTQTLALDSGGTGINLDERCKQYRTLAGPNSSGGA